MRQKNYITKYKTIHGLTFWVVFGSYAGFHAGRTGVCLGWVSIRVMPIDVENTLDILLEENEQLRKQLNKKVTNVLDPEEEQLFRA